MKKQTILITGCSHGGIGYACANYLKSKGHQVFASVRAPDDLEKLKNEGFDVYLIDVNNQEQIVNAFNDILKKTNNKLDVVFNNAGFAQAGALEDIPTRYLKEQFETNFFAVHNITRIALKVMRKQGYGKIIQHGSVLGLISLKYRGAYNASKYALEGMVDTMRQELNGSNIYMTILNTGPVTSNIRANSMKTIKNIEIEGSSYIQQYEKLIAGKHKKVPFNKEAIAVARVVEKILKVNKPAPRYSITKFTRLAKFLKSILPTKLLDRILNKI
ncbi:SDR family NAD(P)-dependent oxidoreductase [Thiotrichales bacterium 19S3-7]|nr:SDR family NAD(P)-dependent oxidoreductase [Thiotrichales bacterium 19S3-7]MCF6801512.1 SDR family NAD(P)-dependent oxidoreductase [Thiotrichales bacterium 19S3-11]